MPLMTKSTSVSAKLGCHTNICQLMRRCEDSVVAQSEEFLCRRSPLGLAWNITAWMMTESTSTIFSSMRQSSLSKVWWKKAERWCWSKTVSKTCRIRVNISFTVILITQQNYWPTIWASKAMDLHWQWMHEEIRIGGNWNRNWRTKWGWQYEK